MAKTSWSSRLLGRSLKARLLVPVAVVLLAVLVGVTIYSASVMARETRINLRNKAADVSRLAAYAINEGTEYQDVEVLKPVVAGLRSDRDVTSVAVYGASGEPIVVDGAAASPISLDEVLARPIVERETDLVVASPVVKDGKRIGALVLGFSPNEARDRAREATLTFALVAGGSFVVCLLLLALAVRPTIRPIASLTRVTEKIVREGDLTQMIEVAPTDEIGRLAAAFSQLVEKLRQIPVSLRDSTSLLTESVSGLSSVAAEQEQILTRQAAALQETQVTVQEIKQTSTLAAQKADAVLKVAERAEEIGRHGEVAIEQSLGALTDIRSQAGEIAQRIGELIERTRQIGLITETVKDLADQSNMLALNAAIEAVRSGEHGKGFSVVAREIRSLADQSIQSTNRVREILDDLSNAIRTTVAITEKGAQKMEGGLVQVRSSGENLRELSSIVKDNSSAVRQIAAAVSQQNAGISQIFAAVSDLNKMMEDTVKKIEVSNRSIVLIRDASTKVSAVVTSFRVS